MAKKSHPQVIRRKRSRFAFVGEVIGELRKVVWPTRQEAMRLTIMVLIVCIVVGIFLGGFDWGFAKLVTKVFLGGS